MKLALSLSLAIACNFSIAQESQLATKSPDIKFTPSGVISTTSFTSRGSLKTGYKEEGELNGVKYLIYGDGSGTFSGAKNEYINELYNSSTDQHNWTVGCYKDEFTDSNFCQISNEEIGVWIYDDNQQVVSYGYLGVIGRPYDFRVDSNPMQTAITTADRKFSIQQSKIIYQELITGKKFKVRFISSNNGDSITKNYDLRGFKEANQYIHWLFKYANNRFTLSRSR